MEDTSKVLYKKAIHVLNAKVGAWFTQEEVGAAIGLPAKNAQALLSKLFAEEVVIREKRDGKFRGVGRFVYAVKFPVDADRLALLNGHLRPKLTDRVTKEKARQGQLLLTRQDAVEAIVAGVADRLRAEVRALMKVRK